MLLRLDLLELDAAPRLVHPVISASVARTLVNALPILFDQLLYSPLLALDVRALLLRRQTLDTLKRSDGSCKFFRQLGLDWFTPGLR
jgi:hypothetical protein